MKFQKEIGKLKKKILNFLQTLQVMILLVSVLSQRDSKVLRKREGYSTPHPFSLFYHQRTFFFESFATKSPTEVETSLDVKKKNELRKT